MSGLSAGPAPIRRLPARQLARRELARPMYRPSLLDRIGHDILHWLSALAGGRSVGPVSWVGPTLVSIVIVAVLAAVVYWAGPGRRRRAGRSRPGPVLDGGPRTADEHRTAADRLAAVADYQGAIIERVRAITVSLETRQILPLRPGRTAAELATETGRAIPAEAAALRSAARLFDDVRYGGRPGSQAGYQQVSELDHRLAAVPATVRPDPEPAR